MKNLKLPLRVWLSAAALSFTTATQAQSSLPDPCNLQTRLTKSIRERFTLPDGQLVPIPVTNDAAQKPTALASRIVGFSVVEFDGTEYKGATTDSARIFWSGARGRDFDYARFILLSVLSSIEVNPVKSTLEIQMPMIKALTMDSLHGYAWNAGTSSFSDWSQRSLNTLNSSGLLASTTIHRPSAGVWEPQSRGAVNWDGNDRMISITNQSWDGTIWGNSNRTSYTYDGAHITQQLLEGWDAGGAAWENDERTVFGYTGSDMTTLTDHKWNKPASEWRNTKRQAFGYDNGQWESTITQNWNTVTSAWDSDKRIVYTRDQGRITQQVTQDWSILTTAWINDRRVALEYDANGRISLLTSSAWDGTTWQLQSRFNYGYTTSGNESTTTVTEQRWISGSSSWENDKRLRMTYNEHNRITQVLFQTWDAGGFWDVASGDDKYDFFYETFDDGTTTVADPAKAVQFRYYPNPSSAYLTVESGNNPIGQVRLMDLAGRTMQQVIPAAGSNTVRIPTAQLSPGMYFLQVQHGGKTETASVLVQH